MDRASLLGVIIGLAMVIFGIVTGDGGFSLLGNFKDIPSIIITIGGSLSSLLGSNKLSGFIAGLKSFALPFKEKATDPGETNKKIISFWETWGEQGPAWGMIGTLVGLVNMLKNLEDSSTIGPNMAVALLTTLYGSLIANWLCAPFANKLKTNNEQEVLMKTLTIEGLLSIQAGENPRVIEEKLKSFLAPDLRVSLSSDAGGEE